MNIGVFIDRDGTINEEMGYINHISRFRIFPFAIEAISLLNKAGLKVVVVSNQSGPARGYFPEELIGQVNDKMVRTLNENGAHLDGIYYCPHHKDAIVPEYKVICNCRKPKTGLLSKAAQELDIEISRSYIVGDRFVDVELARNASAKAILVLSGYGKGELEYKSSGQAAPDFIAEDLLHAAKWILKDIETTNGTNEHE
ncbi:MAG: HAD family hydrolase [Pseudomonadota bacterium]